MKYNKPILLTFITLLILFACTKEEEKSERFILLTSHIWESDSLLIDGLDAGGPGQMLEKFAGDAEFYEDGTGYFGQYQGDWSFTNYEEGIIIISDSLLLPLTANIVELTAASFKITTNFPTAIPDQVLDVKITFIEK